MRVLILIIILIIRNAGDNDGGINVYLCLLHTVGAGMEVYAAVKTLAWPKSDRCIHMHPGKETLYVACGSCHVKLHFRLTVEQTVPKFIVYTMLPQFYENFYNNRITEDTHSTLSITS